MGEAACAEFLFCGGRGFGFCVQDFLDAWEHILIEFGFGEAFAKGIIAAIVEGEFDARRAFIGLRIKDAGFPDGEAIPG